MHVQPIYEYVNHASASLTQSFAGVQYLHYASALLLSTRELGETGTGRCSPPYEYVNDAYAHMQLALL